MRPRAPEQIFSATYVRNWNLSLERCYLISRYFLLWLLNFCRRTPSVKVFVCSLCIRLVL